ncbi:MAG: hypothetical protein AB7E08_05875, partial [Candidatus Omnitrophota bacterium]
MGAEKGIIATRSGEPVLLFDTKDQRMFAISPYLMAKRIGEGLVDNLVDNLGEGTNLTVNPVVINGEKIYDIVEGRGVYGVQLGGEYGFDAFRPMFSPGAQWTLGDNTVFSSTPYERTLSNGREVFVGREYFGGIRVSKNLWVGKFDSSPSVITITGGPAPFTFAVQTEGTNAGIIWNEHERYTVTEQGIKLDLNLDNKSRQISSYQESYTYNYDAQRVYRMLTDSQLSQYNNGDRNMRSSLENQALESVFFKGSITRSDGKNFEIVGGNLEVNGGHKIPQMWVYGNDFTIKNIGFDEKARSSTNDDVITLNGAFGILEKQDSQGTTFKEALFPSREPVLQNGGRVLQYPFAYGLMLSAGAQWKVTNALVKKKSGNSYIIPEGAVRDLYFTRYYVENEAGQKVFTHIEENFYALQEGEVLSLANKNSLLRVNARYFLDASGNITSYTYNNFTSDNSIRVFLGDQPVNADYSALAQKYGWTVSQGDEKISRLSQIVASRWEKDENGEDVERKVILSIIGETTLHPETRYEEVVAVDDLLRDSQEGLLNRNWGVDRVEVDNNGLIRVTQGRKTLEFEIARDGTVRLPFDPTTSKLVLPESKNGPLYLSMDFTAKVLDSWSGDNSRFKVDKALLEERYEPVVKDSNGELRRNEYPYWVQPVLKAINPSGAPFYTNAQVFTEVKPKPEELKSGKISTPLGEITVERNREKGTPMFDRPGNSYHLVWDPQQGIFVKEEETYTLKTDDGTVIDSAFKPNDTIRIAGLRFPTGFAIPLEQVITILGSGRRITTTNYYGGSAENPTITFSENPANKFGEPVMNNGIGRLVHQQATDSLFSEVLVVVGSPDTILCTEAPNGLWRYEQKREGEYKAPQGRTYFGEGVDFLLVQKEQDVKFNIDLVTGVYSYERVGDWKNETQARVIGQDTGRFIDTLREKVDGLPLAGMGYYIDPTLGSARAYLQQRQFQRENRDTGASTYHSKDEEREQLVYLATGLKFPEPGKQRIAEHPEGPVIPEERELADINVSYPRQFQLGKPIDNRHTVFSNNDGIIHAQKGLMPLFLEIKGDGTLNLSFITTARNLSYTYEGSPVLYRGGEAFSLDQGNYRVEVN